MSAKLQRAELPDGARLKQLLCKRAGELVEGAAVIDADLQGPTGVDLLLADRAGRPVFVDIVAGSGSDVAARVFEHLEWLDSNRRLFARAYADAGIVNAEEPLFVFVSGAFPRGAVRAVAALEGIPVRLVRAESFLVDGETEVLLEEVVSPQRRQGQRIPRTRDGGGDGSGPERRTVEIQSEEVRSLLALFRSGVDGLDGRVREREVDGGVGFELGGRTLAFVSSSPASFTVSPGDRLVSPIVVSDRVSLERAMNAVVSLFVREQMGAADRGERPPDGAGLSEEERAELAAAWGGGVAGGDSL